MVSGQLCEYAYRDLSYDGNDDGGDDCDGGGHGHVFTVMSTMTMITYITMVVMVKVVPAM